MPRTLRSPALGLCALAFALAPTRVAAAPDDGLAAIVHPLPSLGLAAGQAVQVNVANVSGDGVAEEGGRLAVWVRLVDADGAELASSESRWVARGRTFVWSVARSDLPRRGRVQVRAEIVVVGPPAGAFVPSVELVDLATGTSSGAIGDVRTVIAGEAARYDAKQGFY